MQAASDRSSHEPPPSSSRKRKPAQAASQEPAPPSKRKRKPSSSSRVAKDDKHEHRSDSQESRSTSMAKSRRKLSDPSPHDTICSTSLTAPGIEDEDEYLLQLAERHQEN